MNHQMDEDLKDLPKLKDSYEGEGEKLKRSTSSSISSNHDEMLEEGEIFDEVIALEGWHKCNICEKTFKTSQELGGHRGSHILQDLKKKSKTHFSNFTKQENEKKNSDLQKSPLPKWQNKNRRGKRCRARYMPATSLTIVPKDNNFYPEVLLPIKKRKLAIGESLKGMEVKPVNKVRVVYNGLMMFGGKNYVADGSCGSGSSGLSESRVDENKVKKKKSKNYDPYLGGYKCSLCGKCFSTFQALGGHCSSHKKYCTSIVHESNKSDVVPVADVQENNSSSTNTVVAGKQFKQH